jgi:hypothetical protein
VCVGVGWLCVDRWLCVDIYTNRDCTNGERARTQRGLTHLRELVRDRGGGTDTSKELVRDRGGSTPTGRDALEEEKGRGEAAEAEGG